MRVENQAKGEWIIFASRYKQLHFEGANPFQLALSENYDIWKLALSENYDIWIYNF